MNIDMRLILTRAVYDGAVISLTKLANAPEDKPLNPDEMIEAITLHVMNELETIISFDDINKNYEIPVNPAVIDYIKEEQEK